MCENLYTMYVRKYVNVECAWLFWKKPPKISQNNFRRLTKPPKISQTNFQRPGNAAEN